MDVCFERCVEELRNLLRGFGQNLCIDGTAFKSWSSGIKNYKTGFGSDDEAGSGIGEKRKCKDGKIKKVVKKCFGYLLRLIVDLDYELAVDFDVSPANSSEMRKLPEIFDEVVVKHPKMDIKTVVAEGI